MEEDEEEDEDEDLGFEAGKNDLVKDQRSKRQKVA